MMKFKKLFISALAASIAFTLASCTEQKSEGAQAVIEKEEDYLSHILVEDYEGYNFRILSRKGMSRDQYVEEETGDIINDAVFKRNEYVKSLFNIDITATETTVGGYETEALSSILAGDDQYDMILPTLTPLFLMRFSTLLLTIMMWKQYILISLGGRRILLTPVTLTDISMFSTVIFQHTDSNTALQCISTREFLMSWVLTILTRWH